MHAAFLPLPPLCPLPSTAFLLYPSSPSCFITTQLCPNFSILPFIAFLLLFLLSNYYSHHFFFSYISSFFPVRTITFFVSLQFILEFHFPVFLSLLPFACLSHVYKLSGYLVLNFDCLVLCFDSTVTDGTLQVYSFQILMLSLPKKVPP